MSSTQNDVGRRQRTSPRSAPTAAAVRAQAFVWLHDAGPAASGADARLRELHHDLRQPLAAVRALVMAAQSDASVSELVADCLARIGNEADRMLELCRHVLERPAERGPVDLAGLVAAAALGCELATGRRVRVEADDVELVVDAVELRRAVANLLDNAARAAGPTGDVLATVRAGVDEVHMTVEDSGPGFTTGSPGIASLGLAIVSAAAGRLGGRVEIGESDLGGARVSLLLPR